MSQRRTFLAASAACAIALLAGCAGGSARPAEPASAPVKESTVVSWYQYDENNTDPKSDERVGNEYLRQALPQFNAAFKGRYTWVNQPQAWDKMLLSLVAAVQGGGEVPDVMQSSAGDAVTTLYQNGAVEDLTDWIRSQAWFAGLDPGAVNACTGPDGRIYCVPVAEQPQLVFYWTAHFPNGYPKTPSEFLVQAEALKAKGIQAVTFFGSTDFDGSATTRLFWTNIASFGGAYHDAAGGMLLNTPENVQAITFLRQIVALGYAPDVVFAGKFQEEEPMKTAQAASMPTGIFGYRYVNPLKSPGGREYNTKTEQDMLNAIDAGDVKLAPWVAPEGHKPSCGLSVTGFVIPKGARNADGARAYINWIMDAGNNAAWVKTAGGGVPALGAVRSDPLFQGEFYKQAIAATAGLCHPWQGTLKNPPEAQKVIATAIYRLIKENPQADIATELQKAQDEYNRQFGPQS